MSMDNGHILRKNAAGKFVLQEYCASSDDYPDVENSGLNNTFDTLEAALLEYSENSDYGEQYYDEYGLSVKIGATHAQVVL